jgi:hypothetical protein
MNPALLHSQIRLLQEENAAYRILIEDLKRQLKEALEPSVVNCETMGKCWLSKRYLRK